MRYCDSNGEHCYSVYDVALASGYQAEEVEGLKKNYGPDGSDYYQLARIFK